MVYELRPPEVTEQLEPTFADPCAPNFRRVGSSPREPRLDAAVPHRNNFQPDISSARISGSISARLDWAQDDGYDGLVPVKKMAGYLPEVPSSGDSNSARRNRGPYTPAIGQSAQQKEADRYRPPPAHCPNRKVGESYIDVVGGNHSFSAIRNIGERKPLRPLNASSLDVFRASKPRSGGTATAPIMTNPRFVGESNESTPHTRTFGTQITPRGLPHPVPLALNTLQLYRESYEEAPPHCRNRKVLLTSLIFRGGQCSKCWQGGRWLGRVPGHDWLPGLQRL